VTWRAISAGPCPLHRLIKLEEVIRAADANQRGAGEDELGERGEDVAAHLDPARAMAWQIFPATSTTRIMNPHFLSETTSYDVASNICQALPRAPVLVVPAPLAVTLAAAAAALLSGRDDQPPDPDSDVGAEAPAAVGEPHPPPRARAWQMLPATS